MITYYIISDLINEVDYEFDTYAEAEAKFNELVHNDKDYSQWYLFKRMTIEKIKEHKRWKR